MRPHLSLGISPCPNDTYIFYAMLHNKISLPFDLSLHMADVEELNTLATRGVLDITKFSVGATANIIDNYQLIRSGAALGWGCGPLVVARTPIPQEQWTSARIAIPGHMTTANLLLSLHGGFNAQRQAMLFDAVMPAIVREEADIGVIIHEGRFTYADYGLCKLLDLGAWWEETYAIPLPLGAIAVKRDMDKTLALAVQEAIHQSLAYANAHPEETQDFVRQHAQEMAAEVTAAHIETFVTQYSLDIDQQGVLAIEKLTVHAAHMQKRTQPLPALFI